MFEGKVRFFGLFFTCCLLLIFSPVFKESGQTDGPMKLKGLPQFFQHAQNSLLDQLADFELGGDLEDDLEETLEGVAAPLDDGIDQTNAETFGNIQEAESSLPSFFEADGGSHVVKEPDAIDYGNGKIGIFWHFLLNK